jgi:flagellar motor switch protein FliN/FliY
LGGAGVLDAAAIDELLKSANFDDPASLAARDPATADGAPARPLDTGDFRLPDFTQVLQDAQVSSIDLLRDVELNVKIELGRARMLVEDVLKLSEGSVVELDKLAGDPVDVFVNDRLVARGEVLVLNDNFCVRVNEIVAGVKEEGV